MLVPQSDDLIADRIYTENFRFVLNQSLEDIWDMIKLMPEERSTS